MQVQFVPEAFIAIKIHTQIDLIKEKRLQNQNPMQLIP